MSTSHAPWNGTYRYGLADRIKAEVLALLGGACDECGATTDLEVNHIYGRDWQVRRYNRYRRWLRYRREAKLNLVNLLCGSCNAAYRPKRFEAAAHGDEPF